MTSTPIEEESRKINKSVPSNSKQNKRDRKSPSCISFEEREANGDESQKEVFVQKYTKGIVAEAVLVGGVPYFLQVKKYDDTSYHEQEEKTRIVLTSEIQLPDMTLLPPERTAYLSKPYEFESRQEIESYIQRARKETLGSLYRRTKDICVKYIDADDDHLIICAADINFTYFQDKLGQTHYLSFVGDNGTGKSNNLTVFQHLGYRP